MPVTPKSLAANAIWRQSINLMPILPHQKRVFLDGSEEHARMMRSATCVNCWHINDGESAAMWRLYLKSNEGIAIQSTYEKLKSSITDERSVFIGIVNYINFETHPMGGGEENYLRPFVFKRESFVHEQELRALYWNVYNPVDGGGVNISTDLGQLIEQVRLAPESPSWLLKLVSDVSKKYGFQFPVYQSKMDEDPVY